jgi:hypothetical protein
MRAPILVFSPGLRVYRSASDAERALLPAGARSLDACDADARPLQAAERLGFFGLGSKRLRLVARATTSRGRRALRDRLAAELVRSGAPRPWAEGAPWGALVAEAVRRFPA